HHTPTPLIYTLFPTRRSSDLEMQADGLFRQTRDTVTPRDLAADLGAGHAVDVADEQTGFHLFAVVQGGPAQVEQGGVVQRFFQRSEEHTSELQSLAYLVCRLL